MKYLSWNESKCYVGPEILILPGRALTAAPVSHQFLRQTGLSCCTQFCVLARKCWCKFAFAHLQARSSLQNQLLRGSVNCCLHSWEIPWPRGNLEPFWRLSSVRVFNCSWCLLYYFLLCYILLCILCAHDNVFAAVFAPLLICMWSTWVHRMWIFFR